MRGWALEQLPGEPMAVRFAFLPDIIHACDVDLKVD
jgi:hypothetical protein